MSSKKEDFCLFEAKDDLSHIKKVLREVKQVINQKDFAKLAHLSDETIHSATVHQDSVNIVVAVLIYSLYKIFQRKHYMKMEGWDEFYGLLMKRIDSMIAAADENDCPRFVEEAGSIRESLNEMHGNLGSYIKDVFYKAEINKGFKLYEHGLSSQKTAELLGVSLWDFSTYIGQTTIHEAHVSITLPEKERVSYVEEFFS